MRKTAATAALLLAATLGGAYCSFDRPSAAADEKKPPAKPELPPLSKFMRAKLAASEMVLDGIVTEDFDKISSGALRLQLITAGEEWKVSEDQTYLDQSAEFRRVLSRLKASAQKKDLDGAALNYVAMTMNCVQCHTEIRKPASPPGEKPKK